VEHSGADIAGWVLVIPVEAERRIEKSLVVSAGADPGGVFAGGGAGFGDHGYFEGQVEWGLG